MLEDGFYDSRKPLRIYWGDLPHWRQDCALYFVTFRLADSLPQVKLRQWRRARDQWRCANSNATSEELQAFTLAQRRLIERWLDRGYGSCLLQNEGVANLVSTSLYHHNGQRYELGDAAIAANHVHALLRPFPGIDVTDVLASWKRYTSTRLGKMGVKASNHFWESEAFDHIVRNAESLDRIRRYIRNHHRQ